MSSKTIWLVAVICNFKWILAQPQQQALGAVCIGDAFNNTGTCMDPGTIQSGCQALGSSWAVSQGNCAPNLQCCYFLYPTFTVPPESTIQPPPLTSFPPFYPTMYPPFFTTTYSPFFPTFGPGPQKCGRLRIAADNTSKNISLPDGFTNAQSRENDNATNSTLKRVKRIVGGQPVQDGDLCYQVAILSGNLIISTGALLSADYVITSYSAIARTDASGQTLKVIPGGYGNINPLLGTIPGFRILRVIAAPGFQANYGPGFPINDAALLQIDRAGGTLDFTRVCVICLPPPNIPLRCLRHFVSGYGSTSEASTVSDGILRRVDLSLIPIAVCQNAYTTVFPGQFKFDSNSMCAGGEGGRDTCNRDGGAPLVCEMFGTGDRYLEGVASWGYGCGRPGFPGVYTNVMNILPWIQQFVQQ